MSLRFLEGLKPGPLGLAALLFCKPSGQAMARRAKESEAYAIVQDGHDEATSAMRCIAHGARLKWEDRDLGASRGHLQVSDFRSRACGVVQ